MTPFQISSVLHIGCSSILLAAGIVLTVPGTLQAQNKASGKSAPDKAALAELQFKEAEALREAYIVLAGANHDYGGHRAKAMNHIQSAVKILDQAVAKNGSAKAKSASAYEDAVAAAAKRATKLTPDIHESQAVSDAQVKKAAATLVEIRPVLVQHKQAKVLPIVDKAINELGIALKIR